MTISDENNNQKKVLETYSRALQAESHVLTKNPYLLWQQLYNRLQWKGEEVNKIIEREYLIRRNSHNSPWFLSLSQPQENEPFQFSFSDHEGQVNHAQFSPDGELIATSSDDGTTYILKADSGKELMTIDTKPYKVKSSVFSKDSKRILLFAEGFDEFDTNKSYYSRAMLWDIKSSKLCCELGGHNRWVKKVVFSPDCTRLATIDDKFKKEQILFLDENQKSELNSISEVRVWDAETGKQLLLIKGNFGEVTEISFNKNGSILVTSCLGDIEEGEEPTGRWIMTGVNQQSREYRKYRIVKNSAVRLWNTHTGKDILTLKGHKDGVTNFALSPDGTKILTIGSDPSAILWDTKTGKKLLVIDDSISSPSFSPDSKYVISNEEDKISLWDMVTGVKVRTFEGHEEWASYNKHTFSGRSIEILDVKFNPSGDQIITSGNDNSARVWDLSTGEELLKLSGHTQPILSAAFSPDGNRVITASIDGSAKVWLITGDAQSEKISGHVGGITSIVFSPKGEKLATSGNDRTLCVWDPNTCKLLSQFGFIEDAVIYYDRLYFGLDENKLATLQVGSCYPRVWNLEDRLMEFRLNHDYDVLTLDYSCDGKYLVTGCNDFNAYIWDAVKGRMLFLLTGHKSWVRTAAIDPSSTYIVTGSSDQSIRIWNASNGKLVKTLKTHTGKVDMVVFNEDGNWFASSSQDQTVIIWDFHKKQPVFTLPTGSHSIKFIEFSKDGRLIACLARDGRVVIAEIPSESKQKTIFSRNKPEELKILQTFNGIHVPQINAVGRNDPDEFNSPGLISINQQGDHLFTICKDGFIRIWHIETGKEVALYPLVSATRFALSPSKSMLAAGDAGGKLHILELVSTRSKLNGPVNTYPKPIVDRKSE